MLSATCDTFLATLQSCMDMAGARAPLHSNASPAAGAAVAALTRNSDRLPYRSDRLSNTAAGLDLLYGSSPAATGASTPPLNLTFVANAGEEALWQPPVTNMVSLAGEAPCRGSYQLPLVLQSAEDLSTAKLNSQDAVQSAPFRSRTPISQRKVLTFFR